MPDGELEPTAPPPKPGGLGERLINGLLYWWQLTLKSFLENVSTWAKYLPPPLNLLGTPAQLGEAQREIEGFLADPDIDPELRRTYLSLRGIWEPAAIIISIPIAIMGYWHYLSARWDLTKAIVTYRAQAGVRAARLDPDTTARMRFADVITPEQFRSTMLDLGYRDEDQLAILDMVRRAPDLPAIMDLYNRGELTPDRLTDWLRRMGYSEIEQTELTKLFSIIPGVADLVRMAVREAFSPEIVSQYQLHADFPADFATWAEKSGLTREWALAYWAAHWELPSVQMGYEMLHRGVIGMDDLRTLLRTLDVMPFWRDKLIAISYSPYTRVDVRRMYGTGILNRAQVKRSYLDIGYDEEHAENLTEFATREQREAEKDLSKADVLDGYRKRLLTRAEVTRYLTGFGYSAQEAEFYLSREDYKLEQDRYTETVTTVGSLYKSELIDESSVYARLGEQNVPAEHVRELLRLWDVQRAGKTQRPSPASLREYLRFGIVDEGRYRQEMRGHGYLDEYVDWELMRIRMEPDARMEQQVALRRLERALEPKRPTVTQLVAFLKGNVISQDQFTEEMRALGFSNAYITWFVDATLTQAAEKELKQELDLGTISEAQFRIEMKVLGYSDTYIDFYLKSRRPRPA